MWPAVTSLPEKWQLGRQAFLGLADVWLLSDLGGGRLSRSRRRSISLVGRVKGGSARGWRLRRWKLGERLRGTGRLGEERHGACADVAGSQLAGGDCHLVEDRAGGGVEGDDVHPGEAAGRAARLEREW